MSSARFTRLNQSDDYRLDDVPHNPPQYINPATYQQQVYQQQLYQHQHAQVPPPAWQSPAHEKLTYVSTPTEYHSEQKPLNQDGKDQGRRSSRLSFLGRGNPVSNFRIPKFAAPWQHEELHPLHLSSRSNTVRYFDRSKQWWRLFINGLLQWFMTVGVAGMIAIALYGFSQLKPLERWQRYTFNAIMTLLSLCISLSIVSALRSYAKLLSWRFLATEYRDLQDFELIMNCHSQSKVLKLLWAGRSPGRFRINRTQLLCITSLGLVIGLQVVIALMGLTYSTESSSQYVSHVHGNVSLVDLSDIRQNWLDPNYSDYLHRAGAANYYGDVGSSYSGYSGNPGDLQWGEISNPDYTGPECIGYPGDSVWNSTFFYKFGELSTRPENVMFGETRRYIQTNATCKKLQIVSGGTTNDTYVKYYDEFGVRRTVYYWSEVATYTTTYMTNTSDPGCGPRCSRMLAIDIGSDITDPTDLPYLAPVLWACNSTVGQVVNSETCTYKENCTLSDDLARIAAGAIGLSGIAYEDSDFQFLLYPAASRYSYNYYTTAQATNPIVRSSLVAWFSAAVIAAMDDSGPRILAPGMEPQTGQILEVEWNLCIPVLAIVPAVQLIVLIIVCLYANGAMVKDGSYLSTARLLRPIVEKLEHHGCALTGDEIARELGNFRVIYGARAPKGRSSSSSSAYTPAAEMNVDWHSGIIFESEGFGQQAAEGWLPGRVWPAGRYDGVGYTDEELAGPELPPRQRKGMQPIVEEASSDDDFDDVTDEKSHLL